MLGSSTERRRRKKDSDRDRDRDRDRERAESKDKERRRSTRKHRSSSKERDRDTSTRERPRAPQSSSSQSHSSSSRKMSVPIVPEMERRASTASPGASKTSLPYPTFSKAHSKEAVGSREEPVMPGVSLYTPDPTDLGHDKQGQHSGEKVDSYTAPGGAAPPSPPLTAADPDCGRSSSVRSTRRAAATATGESDATQRSPSDGLRTSTPKQSTSRSSLRQNTVIDEGSFISVETESTQPSTVLSDSQPKVIVVDSITLSPNGRPPGRSVSGTSQRTQSTTDSDATSVAPERKTTRQRPSYPLNRECSPLSAVDSSPRTPTPQEPNFPHHVTDRKETPMVEVFVSNDEFRPQSVQSTRTDAPPPPPPPPYRLPGTLTVCSQKPVSATF